MKQILCQQKDSSTIFLTAAAGAGQESLQWEVISDCNHKCIHCYKYCRADNLDVVSHSDFDAITEQIKPCIQRIINAGIKVSVSSNGTLITDEIVVECLPNDSLSSQPAETVPGTPAVTPPNANVCEICGKPVPERLRKCILFRISLDREKPEAIFRASSSRNGTNYFTTLEIRGLTLHSDIAR